jgi:uncharacterized protein YjbJ (UPF0337 family)
MFKANDSAWNKIAGNWKQFSGEIRRKWGLLTDDDIEQIHGHRDILIGRLQERYGYAQEDAQRKIEEWERSLGL